MSNFCKIGMCKNPPLLNKEICKGHDELFTSLYKSKIKDCVEAKCFTYEDDIYCPECGYKQHPDDCTLEYKEEEISVCEKCFKKFIIQTHITYEYSTRSIDTL